MLRRLPTHRLVGLLKVYGTQQVTDGIWPDGPSNAIHPQTQRAMAQARRADTVCRTRNHLTPPKPAGLAPLGEIKKSETSLRVLVPSEISEGIVMRPLVGDDQFARAYAFSGAQADPIDA